MVGSDETTGINNIIDCLVVNDKRLWIDMGFLEK